ncbi:hypothetical protein TWF751_009194 [Orbilia oligospora]|nr:hypothetical protein TWF751_009194 [Orbilia oligospora]
MRRSLNIRNPEYTELGSKLSLRTTLNNARSYLSWTTKYLVHNSNVVDIDYIAISNYVEIRCSQGREMIQPFKLWWIVAQRAIYTKENDTLFSYMCFAPSLFFRFDYVHSDLNPPAVARHGILLDEILKRKSSD